MNIVEQRIWDYLDGNCNAREAAIIAQLIESDPVFKSAYNDIKAIDLDLAHLELDEPSMSFNRNVMENIRVLPTPGSVKDLIDKRIIYSITGFFLITIFVLLGILLASTNWGDIQGLTIPESFKVHNLQQYLNSTVIKGFLFFDLVLILFFVDNFFRKRINAKH